MNTEVKSNRRLAPTVPLLLGIMGGILVVLDLPLGWLIAAAGLVWCVLDRSYLLCLLVLLGGGLGFGVASYQLSKPKSLQAWYGAHLTVKGHWDGQFLSITEPRARMSLSPKPEIPRGNVVASGVLVAPEGQRIPGGFHQESWFRSQGGILPSFPTPSGVLVGATIKSSSPEMGFRTWFDTGLAAGLGQRQAALMRAIELGNISEINREQLEGYSVREAFTRAGLAHLMALSGQNVALLVGALVFLLTRLPLPTGRLYGWWRYGLPAVLLGFYLVGLVGVSPSITRAVIMGVAVLLALWAGRGRPDTLGTIALAAVACLLLFPFWLLDVGFQLSFLAVLGLTQTRRLAERLPSRWPMGLRLALAVPLVAELATLPVIASQFGQLPLVGLPANILAEFLMAALVPLGFLAGLMGPLGWIPNLLVAPLASGLLALVEFFSQFTPLTWGHIGWNGWAAYGLFVVAVWYWLRGWIRGWLVCAVVAFCATMTSLPGLINPVRELVFIDVGQGDSTLLRTPELTMLIDGGGSVRSEYDVGGRVVWPALRWMGVRKLDVVVATHADTDHIEGLAAILDRMPVGELWIGERKRSDPVLAAVLEAAERRGVPIREVRRGDGVRAGRVQVDVLWPMPPFSREDNDNSVVLRLVSGDWKGVVLGDLSAPTEARLGLGKLDLLKVAHHGSRWSTSAELLAETRPKNAVVSVGRNGYGHPHGVVLERLKAAGIHVWRTDEMGTIRWPLP